jgi:hypothetical protein
VRIAASVAGNGDGSSGGVVSLTSHFQLQRSGLALSNGSISIAFSAHEDATPCHGWLLGYSASNAQQPVGVFNTTPNGVSGADGGIWAAAGAPTVDSLENGGHAYASTGNGVFDEGLGMALESDYGDCILRLGVVPGLITPNGANLQLNDWFTPDDSKRSPTTTLTWLRRGSDVARSDCDAKPLAGGNR